MNQVPIETASEAAADRRSGAWTLAGDRLIIAEPGAPATLLVPGESVLLLAVDLPLASKAKRLEALPFAIEDRIADPIEAVHLAIGAEISPKRYLVGVVRHAVMTAWTEQAAALGIAHAAMVPDALALPTPPEGEWAVDLGESRAVVRVGDGTGFAIPAAMLMAAWEAAGRPGVHAVGAPLPAGMDAKAGRLSGETMAVRLAAPALDLRQGLYARGRQRAAGNWPRRLGWIVALGALAHAGIAAADTLMLKVIAERRADDTRALVATMAPGTALGADLAGSVADMLPVAGPTGAGGGPFLPLVTRVSTALAPLSSDVQLRTMQWQGQGLTLKIDAAPGLVERLRSAMRDAQLKANVTETPDGIQMVVNAQ